MKINGQACVAPAEQFQSYKKVLTARYPKVQVLFAAKDYVNPAFMRALTQIDAGTDFTATMERPAWQY
jgi:diaminopimelate decarboxylase